MAKLTIQPEALYTAFEALQPNESLLIHANGKAEVVKIERALITERSSIGLVVERLKETIVGLRNRDYSIHGSGIKSFAEFSKQTSHERDALKIISAGKYPRYELKVMVCSECWNVFTEVLTVIDGKLICEACLESLTK